jgi:uncharacterized protein YjlB
MPGRQQRLLGGWRLSALRHYDECRPTAEDHERSVKSVEKVKRPGKDPVFGAKGPLLKLWKPKR